MTYPTPSTFTALSFPTASDLNSLGNGINYIIASGLGNIGTSTLNAQTDFTSGGGTVASVTVNVISGRRYLVTGAVTGTQVTGTGTPTIKLLIAGVEVYRLMSGVSFASTVVGWGTVSWLYTAASSTSVTFSITGLSSANAFRIAANAGQLAVADYGVL